MPRVYRLIVREPTGGRPLSRFVGRDRELTALDGLLARVVAGTGHVVMLMGEAGVGKSRVPYEFRWRLGASRTRRCGRPRRAFMFPTLRLTGSPGRVGYSSTK